ncbi:hypothetical protein [Cotesia plutellae polydnavirus]|nr:hypothetical protein [Cotesia plutellae polydnavirus]
MFPRKIPFVLLVAIVGTLLFLGSGSAAAGVIYPNQLSAIQYGIGYQQSDTPNGYGSQQYTAQTGSNNQQSSMQQMDINQLPPLSYDRTYVKKFIARLRATNSQSTSESGSRNEQSTSQQENLNQIPSDSGKTVVQRALEHLRANRQHSTTVSSCDNERLASQQKDFNQNPSESGQNVVQLVLEHLRANRQQSTTVSSFNNERSDPQQKDLTRFLSDLNKTRSESDKILLQQVIEQWISDHPEYLEQHGYNNKQGKVVNGNLYQIDINQILTYILVQEGKSIPEGSSSGPNNNNPYEGRPILTWLNNVFKWKLCMISGFTAC